MPWKQYEVQWDYSTIFRDKGRSDYSETYAQVGEEGLSLNLRKGQIVKLEEDVADWVNRDSPGTLVEVSS